MTNPFSARSFPPASPFLRFLARQIAPWSLFVLGAGWLLIRTMGLRFSVIPGVYGDTRLINFILEHFYQWVLGVQPSLWDTLAFYPYPLTLAFSDNLLGVAPLYVPLRWAGLDRESALQAWLLLGFFLNFASSAWVLARLRFHPAGVAVGAFLFTFGLPMMAHLSHMQLVYRLGVPLACYALWQFAHEPRLRWLAAVIVIIVWQVYAGIYIGVLLVMLLAALVVVLPWLHAGRSVRGALGFWPGRIRSAWAGADWAARASLLLLVGLALGAGGYLFWPYVTAQRLYGFGRDWSMVSTMLPRVTSYFVADQLTYWKPISIQLWGMPTMRNEHQLFIGWMMTALVIAGIVGALRGGRRSLAMAHLAAAALLVALTLEVNGFSLYRAVYALPGMNSIRSVTRVQLVLLWPLGLLAACGTEWILRAARGRALALAATGLILGAVFFEMVFWKNPVQFSKRHAQERMVELRAQLPASVPDDPILFLAVRKDESEVVSETDGMMLAQSLGWVTANGYFGNFPPGYQPAVSCRELPARILNYMAFAGITDERVYLDFMGRAVPVGFSDCDPAWWQEMPSP